MKKYFPSSELIINEDGSVFHLHVKPEWLADKVILVGDPGRVALVASHFENKECEVESREFKTVTGTFLVLSTRTEKMLFESVSYSIHAPRFGITVALNKRFPALS